MPLQARYIFNSSNNIFCLQLKKQTNKKQKTKNKKQNKNKKQKNSKKPKNNKKQETNKKKTIHMYYISKQ